MATSTNFPTTPDPTARSTTPTSDEARQLAERVAGGAHALVDRTVERVGPAVDRLKSGAAEASNALHARADQLSAKQQQMLEDTRTSVREHPMGWVLGAFAVGLLLGRIGRG